MKAAIVALLFIHVSFASVITPFSSPDNMEEVVGGFLQESESPLVAVYMFTNPVDALFAAVQFFVALVLIYKISWIPDSATILLAAALVISGLIDLLEP